MEPVEPISTVELFPLLSRELLTLLKSLDTTDWSRLTICAPWSVKDVAAHLLGGNLGRLWKRDDTSDSPRVAQEDLAALIDEINRDNASWVQAARIISPEILIEFLSLTDHRLYRHFRSLVQDEPARITVAWAGDTISSNWFDIAREYTEKWLHQQHIREAVGQPLLMSREFLFPVLDTFMRALPYTYRNLEANDGISISVLVSGEAGGTWTLVREHGAWRLFSGRNPRSVSVVQIDQDLAWRLFSKGIDRGSARQRIRIDGNQTLGIRVSDMISIMA